MTAGAPLPKTNPHITPPPPPPLAASPADSLELHCLLGALRTFGLNSLSAEMTPYSGVVSRLCKKGGAHKARPRQGGARRGRAEKHLCQAAERQAAIGGVLDSHAGTAA